MGKLARINAKKKADEKKTINILAKALSAYLPPDQAIYIEYDEAKYVVYWSGDTLMINGANDEEHPNFQDGMILQARPTEENVLEITPETTEKETVDGTGDANEEDS